MPIFIEELTEILNTGKVQYDQEGVQYLNDELVKKFENDAVIRETYVPDFTKWLY